MAGHGRRILPYSKWCWFWGVTWTKYEPNPLISIYAARALSTASLSCALTALRGTCFLCFFRQCAESLVLREECDPSVRLDDAESKIMWGCTIKMLFLPVFNIRRYLWCFEYLGGKKMGNPTKKWMGWYSFTHFFVGLPIFFPPKYSKPHWYLRILKTGKNNIFLVHPHMISDSVLSWWTDGSNFARSARGFFAFFCDTIDFTFGWSSPALWSSRQARAFWGTIWVK